jgi:hypothetical protein
MASWYYTNPIHLVIPLALLSISLPLLLFAVLTTLLALATLLLRVLVVYSDLALVLLRHWLFHADPPLKPSPPPDHELRLNPSRRSSAASSSAPSPLRSRPGRSDSYASLLGAGVPNRDYEGVGGWRGDEDEDWAALNSRLELPAGTPALAATPAGVRHRRSFTGSGSRLNLHYAVKMSPVAGRTPGGREEVGGYFDVEVGRRRSVGGRRSGESLVDTQGTSGR